MVSSRPRPPNSPNSISTVNAMRDEMRRARSKEEARALEAKMPRVNISTSPARSVARHQRSNPFSSPFQPSYFVVSTPIVPSRRVVLSITNCLSPAAEYLSYRLFHHLYQPSYYSIHEELPSFVQSYSFHLTPRPASCFFSFRVTSPVQIRCFSKYAVCRVSLLVFRCSHRCPIAAQCMTRNIWPPHARKREVVQFTRYNPSHHLPNPQKLLLH